MKNLTVMKLKNRINLLTGRDPVGNMRIVNKLKTSAETFGGGIIGLSL